MTVRHQSTSDARPFNPMERLVAIGREYRHLIGEQQHEAPGGATRRRLSKDLLRLRERFEQMLDHWVSDPPLRESWLEYFYHRGEQPHEPVVATPPLFRGKSDSGAWIEIFQAEDGGYDVVCDGVRSSHSAVPWHLEPELLSPVQIDEWACTEESRAPEPALAALRDFLAGPGVLPPWQ